MNTARGQTAGGSPPDNVGRAIVHALRCEGVNTLFGIVGSHVVDIYDALIDAPEIRAITPKHEVGATFMAAAYARMSGRVGVCVTTAGPGVLNALNGLGQARFSALPVVLIAGGVPLRAKPYELHGLTQEDYTFEAARRVAKHAVRVSSAEQVSEAISVAFAAARSGRPGPAYVEIPWDLFGRTLPAGSSAYQQQPLQPARFSISQVEAAVTAAMSRSRVALVLDKGLAGSAQLAPLQDLARRRGWVVCTTRDGMNLVSFDDEVFGGVLHDHRFGRYAFDRVADAEVCIAIGFDRGSENFSFVQNNTRGQVLELCAFEDTQPGEEGVTLEEALRSFIDRSSAAGRQPAAGWPQLERPRDGHARLLEEVELFASSSPIHFGHALSCLERQLGDSQTVIVHDTGSHEVWARSILPPTEQRFALGGGNWGTMGHAIPSAAGVRAAHPRRRIVCVTGDGCLLMSLMDLPTLIELGGPTLIVNLNDSEYGMITKVQQKAFGRSCATRLPGIDFARVAREFGATSARVTDPAALGDVFGAALRSDMPYFVDVIARSDSRYPDFVARGVQKNVRTAATTS